REHRVLPDDLRDLRHRPRGQEALGVRLDGALEPDDLLAVGLPAVRPGVSRLGVDDDVGRALEALRPVECVLDPHGAPSSALSILSTPSTAPSSTRKACPPAT